MKKYYKIKDNPNLSDRLKADFNYKYFVDEDIGFFEAGVSYYEFDGEFTTRQLQIYVDGWLSSDFGFLYDSTFSSSSIEAEDELTAEEFEWIWLKLKYCLSSLIVSEELD